MSAKPITPFLGAVPAAFPKNESERIQKLLSYEVLDTEKECAYDDLTRLAAHICGTPIGLVSLVDVSRQWFKASQGLGDVAQTPRDLAFCAHAILKPQVLVVPNALEDSRFANNPLVTGEPHIRFYAGAPLISPEGYALGTLCVIDSVPRELSSSQIDALETLARQVVSQLEMRLTVQQVKREIKEREQAEAQLKQANADLEDKIKERTTLIAQKNTQLEAALQELQQAQIHLVHSEKISSLGQLVSGVAHEINNPLGFVSGSIGHLKGYTADLVELLELYQSLYGEDHPDIGDKLADVDINFVKEDIFKLLSSMKIGTQRMIEIVRSLRNFSRLDHNGFQLANIHDGIDSTLMLLSYRMAQVGPQQSAVAVVKEYGNLPEINCDIGQLNQVFMNLFANAVDAFDEMSNDTEVIKPSLTIGTQQQGDWIVINISDNGPGMPPEMLKDIFQPFFTTKPTNRGTGLGLSISHQVITEKHRGEISCYSQLGKGTTFTIRLPM